MQKWYGEELLKSTPPKVNLLGIIFNYALSSKKYQVLQRPIL
jgi:hypothetical protein